MPARPLGGPRPDLRQRGRFRLVLDCVDCNRSLEHPGPVRTRADDTLAERLTRLSAVFR